MYCKNCNSKFTEVKILTIYDSIQNIITDTLEVCPYCLKEFESFNIIPLTDNNLLDKLLSNEIIKQTIEGLDKDKSKYRNLSIFLLFIYTSIIVPIIIQLIYII